MFDLEEIKAFQKTWNEHNSTELLKADGSYGPNTKDKLLISPFGGW